MTHKPIRKAVFPVAGLGTRFLPATKAMPKEMLTIVDRPVIEIVVEEAQEAGIEHFIFVTGRNKGVIEDHFDRPYELVDTLKQRGKTAELALIEDSLPQPGQFSFTRQQEPLGLGHAVWCARELVSMEPFALLLPDMVMQGEKQGCLAQMMTAYEHLGGNILALEEVPLEETAHYGVVATEPNGNTQLKITGMVEKPDPENAPSNLIISGRYILQPEIFNILETQKKGAGGEIQITDAMRTLLTTQPFHGALFNGATYDCGDKIGFLMANIARALREPGISEEFKRRLQDLMDREPGPRQPG